MKFLSKNSGFTFIELIVGVSLFFSLITISWINFSTLPSKVSLTSSYDLLYSDIRGQQSLAMNSNSEYGVHLENDHYVLFKGGVYDSNAQDNYNVYFDNDNIKINNILFNSGNIIFEKKTGIVLSYDANNNSFTLSDDLSLSQKIIKLNKYAIEI